jgi:hypothetical protein
MYSTHPMDAPWDRIVGNAPAVAWDRWRDGGQNIMGLGDGDRLILPD